MLFKQTSQPPVVKILNNKTSCDVDMISANITNKNEQQKGDPGIIADKSCLLVFASKI